MAYFVFLLCVQAEITPVAVPEPEVVPAEPVADAIAEDFVVTESAVAVEAAMSEPAAIEEPVSPTVAYFFMLAMLPTSVCVHTLYSDSHVSQPSLGSC